LLDVCAGECLGTASPTAVWLVCASVYLYVYVCSFVVVVVGGAGLLMWQRQRQQCLALWGLSGAPTPSVGLF